MEEIARVTPIYGGVSYDRLGTGGLQWPCPSKDHPGTGILHAEKFSVGLARFRPVEHKEPFEAPEEEFPLLLTTGRSLYHFHTGTMTRRTSLLDREVPGPYVEMNPEDAKKFGVRGGQKVVVESRRGQLYMDARLTLDVPKGTLFVPFHFSEACANVLTSQALDPKSKIPEFKVTAARVRRAD
jgi:predicted molibdopterin-dependent oxidoreductase YjgC